jgi:pantoate--beta-alanine ligase
MVRIVRTADQLAPFHQGAFVPTMGALHAGHQALIACAAGLGRPVVVSIFVNPAQFGPNEDFTRYPRRLKADAATAEMAGADVVFAPDVATVYPPNVELDVPPLPAVATRPGLEDAHRPGHFAGVVKVVARLFDLIRPRWAVFGEKDYQQLLTIEAMVAASNGRWGDLTIVRHETIREHDGLAMSSRNMYLATAQRRQALGVWHAMREAKQEPTPAQAELVMRTILEEHGFDVDYAVVRDAATLMPIETYGRPARMVVAARLGGVRLIDNLAVECGLPFAHP